MGQISGKWVVPSPDVSFLNHNDKIMKHKFKNKFHVELCELTIRTLQNIFYLLSCAGQK